MVPGRVRSRGDVGTSSVLSSIGIGLRDTVTGVSPGGFRRFSETLLAGVKMRFASGNVGVSGSNKVSKCKCRASSSSFEAAEIMVRYGQCGATPIDRPSVGRFLNTVGGFRTSCKMFVAGDEFAGTTERTTERNAPVALVSNGSLMELIVGCRLCVAPMAACMLSSFCSRR